MADTVTAAGDTRTAVDRFVALRGAVTSKSAVVIEFAVILALWEIAVSGLHLWNAVLIPPPSAVWSAFWRMVDSGTLTDSLAFSATNAAIGFTLAVVIGIALGVGLGTSRWVADLATPPFWAAFNTPKIAIQPLLVLWLGFGSAPKILIIFLLVFFPVVINTWDGLRGVQPSLINAARVFGAGKWAVFAKVQAWAALPMILTGVRMGVSRAVVGIVVGEFIGGSKGLGYLILNKAAQSELDAALAITVVLVLMAGVGMLLVSIVRRMVAPWYVEGVDEP